MCRWDEDRRALFDRHPLIIQVRSATTVQNIDEFIPVSMHVTRNARARWHELGAEGEALRALAGVEFDDDLTAGVE